MFCFTRTENVKEDKHTLKDNGKIVLSSGHWLSVFTCHSPQEIKREGGEGERGGERGREGKIDRERGGREREREREGEREIERES